jgi:hypothetical protein
MVEQAVGEKELLVISHLTFFSCHLEIGPWAFGFWS